MKMIRSMLQLLLLGFVISCDLPYEYVDSYFEKKVEGHSLYDNALFYGPENYSQVRTLVRDRVTWTEDPEKIWQEPELTWTLGTGDCEDIAILYLNILYFATGEKGYLALVRDAKEVVTGGYTVHHVIVNVGGEYRDPVSWALYGRDEIQYEYYFDRVFSGSM
ncbi:MAG: hypothetical protein PQJ59_00820 [Spirochaetales bacterium]|nr:hypothetical protein [Spirochaetales bacterium]